MLEISNKGKGAKYEHNHKEQANHRVPADGSCGPRDDGEAPRDQGRPEAEGTASSGWGGRVWLVQREVFEWCFKEII